MPNIPNATTVVPGIYDEVRTIQTGVSIPIGVRLGVIIAEGLTEEILVGSANGKGNDGFDPTYSTTRGSDSRHFLLGKGQVVVAPVVPNRSMLFKNGITLNVLEHPIDNNTFDNRFDARLDPVTGEIELQTSSLVDQGGSFYLASGSNVGTGTIGNLTLVDPNAPPETWTIRCSSVRRDTNGNPIDGYAKFIARGSVSGTLLDGYGNQISWQSNDVVVSNGILSFSITEGLTPFTEGDNFAIEVAGGALVAGDSLSASYISQISLNQPTFFTDLNALVAQYGQPSATNRLSLGAQLAWDNGTPGIWSIQAMPSVPRRVSYPLVESADGNNDLDSLTFDLPLNVTPDVNSNINFFITDPITKKETQVIPNKVAFYNSGYTASPSSFIFGGDQFSYTVVEEASVQKEGLDGALMVTSSTTATLSSVTVKFGIEDLSATRSVQIIDSANGNSEIATITGISGGKLQLNGTFGTSESSLHFLVLDSVATSARILFTPDLALSLGQSLRCTVVDTKDADFYDAGWVEAYAAAEKLDIDMVCPLPSQTISTIFQNGKVHVEKQSNIRNRHERILLIGAIQGLTPDNVIGNTLAAVEDIGVLEGIQGDTVSEILDGNIEDLANYSVSAAFGDSFRVVYFYPDQIVVQAGASNIFVDGFFVGAAALGYLSSNTQIQEPLTNKILVGFNILNTKLYSPLVTENIVNQGITLLTPVQGGGNIIWGKTTVSDGEPTEQEISIVFIRDAVAFGMRTVLKPYVGRTETPTFKATLFQVAQNAAKAFIQQKLITTFGGLTVNRDAVEPRQWNVTLSVQPTYPFNWGYVIINIGVLPG
jgi:hypothetical protein